MNNGISIFEKKPSFTLPTGVSTVTFSVVPINGLAPGTVTLLMKGFDTKNNINCTTPVEIELNSCEATTNKTNTISEKTKFSPTLVVAPNPAKASANINYSTKNENSFIEIYSILGRLVTTHVTNSTKGTWQVDTSSIPTGIYIVVLKDNYGVITQQKLIIQ